MFRRAAVPSSALRALRALIAPASTATQNQQEKNLQNGCCTNPAQCSANRGFGLYVAVDRGCHVGAFPCTSTHARSCRRTHHMVKVRIA